MSEKEIGLVVEGADSLSWGSRHVACGRLEKDCPYWRGDDWCVHQPQGNEDPDFCLYYGLYLGQLVEQDFKRDDNE